MATNLGTWKRTMVVAAAAAMPVAVALGGSAALAESHGASVPARSVRVDSQRADLPSAALPATIRSEATTYRVSGDECAGSVCVEGVAVTTPEAEVSSVGGPTSTPTAEIGTGTVSAAVTVTEGSVGASAYYGAIGVSHEISPNELMPRH